MQPYHEDTGAEWIPLSPKQIRGRLFRDAPMTRRGYLTEEVDAFVDQMAVEVERWGTLFAEAQSEIQRLRNYYRSQVVGGDSRATVSGTDSAAALAHARVRADQIVADAVAKAANIQSMARSDADAVAAQAHRKAAAAVAWGAPQPPGNRERLDRVEAYSRGVEDAIARAMRQLDEVAGQLRTATDTVARQRAAISSDAGPAGIGA